MTQPDPAAIKQSLRAMFWSKIRTAGAARFPGVEGRIPNFVGAEAAAALLATAREFQNARVLKCNPDLPQRPVRHAALKAGKIVVLAEPKLASEKCFVILDPRQLTTRELWTASSITGARQLGTPVAPESVPTIDLVVCGCVAVGPNGARLGKGGGYADLEYSLLRELGLIRPETPVCTTVHTVQYSSDINIPREPHDTAVELVATPDRLHHINPRLSQPSGILWDRLPHERLPLMPSLAARKSSALDTRAGHRDRDSTPST